MLEGVRVNPATLYYCDYNNADTPASWTDYYDEIYVTSDATSTYYNAIYNGTAYYDENGKLTTSATHIVNNTLLNGYYTDYYGNITTNSTTIINNTPLNGNFYYDLNGNIVDEYYQVVDTVNIQNYINSNNDNTFIQFNNNYSVNLQEYLNSQNVPRYKTYEFLSGTGTNIIDDGDANYIITLPKNASYSYNRTIGNNDLIISFGESDNVTIKNYLSGSNISHSSTINGLLINELIANNVNETYDYSSGCNVSKIISNGGTDTLKFANDTNLTFERTIPSSDLIIRYGNKSVTLKNYFNNNHSVTNINGTPINTLINNNLNEIYDYSNGCNTSQITSNGGIDSLKYTNGTTLNFERNMSNNDLIVRDSNRLVTLKDYFLGNHSVTKIGDNNISDLIVNNVNETYTLTDNGSNIEMISNGGIDTLKFPEGLNLIYEHDLSDNDLIIKYGNSSVTLKDYFLGNHSVTKIGENNISDLIVNNVNETYTLTDNASNTEIISNGGTDNLIFPQNAVLSYEHDFATNNLIIYYGNSSVTLKDYFLGNHSVTKIGDNNISDLINNYSVKNTYILTNNEDNTIINSDVTFDTLKFPDGSLIYEHDLSNNDLVIKYGNSSVTLKDYFLGNHSITKIGDNNISDLIANNVNETYTLTDNGSNTEITSNGGTDTLKFPVGSLIYEHDLSNNDLVIKYGNSSVTLKDYYTGNYSVTKIGDNNISDLIANNVNETYTLTDNGSNTEITSNGGTDTLKFPVGSLIYEHDLSNNDLVIKYGNSSVTLKDYYTGNYSVTKIGDNNISDLISNNVNETYTLTDNGSNTEITSNGGTDTLKFPNSLLIYEHDLSNNDLVIKYGNSSVTLKDYFAINNYSVKSIIQNSNLLNIATEIEKGMNIIHSINRTSVTGTNGNDTIINDVNATTNTILGGKGDDYIINEGKVYDSIFGGAGDDEIINNGNIHISTKGTIDGGVGNDTITSEGDVIYVYGGEGNDSITFNGNSSYIFGDEGNDTITANSNSTIEYGISGGDGDDVINYYGGVKDYSIYGRGGINGNNGDDTINIYNSANKVNGEDGNDVIIIHYGNILRGISGGTGNDKLYCSDINGCSFIFGVGDGQDTIYSGSQTDTIEIYGLNNNNQDISTADLTFIKKENDLIINYSDNDNITLDNYFATEHSVKNVTTESGTTSLDTLLVNNVVIQGTESNETINGTNYNDTIYGGNGNKIINAGTGDDLINIGYDNNIIKFSNGDGNDTINNSSINSTLWFTDSQFNELKYSVNNYDLIITYNNNENSVTLKDYMLMPQNLTLKNANEETAYIFDKLIMNPENKSLYNVHFGINLNNMSHTNFNYVPYSDYNSSYQTYTGIHLILYKKVTENEVYKIYYNHFGSGINYHYHDTVNLTLKVNEKTTNRDLYNGYSIDFIYYASNSTSLLDKINKPGTQWTTYLLGGVTDNILMGSDYDYFVGGEGNDYLYGGNNNKTTFLFSSGDGNDIIYSYDNNDEIEFTDVNLSDISVSKSENDIILSYGETDTIRLINEYTNAYDISIKGANGSKKSILNMYRNIIDNSITQETTIYGTLFNDSIISASGIDEIIYSGTGNDIIQCNGGNDIIDGGDGKNKYIYSTVASGNDTIINGIGDDTICFETETSLSYSKPADSNDLIITHNSGTINLKDFFVNDYHSVNTINNGGTISNIYDQLYFIGIQYNNITSNGDTITGTQYKDIIYTNTGNDTIYGYDGDDDIYGGDGNDYIIGGNGNDTIYGENGNDHITGDAGNNLLCGGKGNDILNGGTGNNTYVFNVADGQDTIVSGSGDDTISFNTSVNLSYSILNNDYIISYGDNDYITLKDYFSGYHSVETIINGEDTIYLNEKFIFGTNGADSINAYAQDGVIIIAKSGNDEISGSSLNDILYGNDGNDWIDGYEGDDIIYGGSGDDELFGGWGNNSNTIYGGEGFDQLHGCDGNDFLYGEAGDDLLVASQGNDYLDGGSGFNQIAYVFADECNEGDELASGHDIIANGEGEDTIYFSYFNREANTQDDSKPAILSYDINNSDLVITYNQDNTITLKDFFVSYSHSVKTINNCGTKIDIDDVISQLISTGSTSNDTITASDDGDIIFTGEGNDVIYVGLGNDIVNGCTGNDTIYSGAGNNILYGGSSDDSYIISNLTNFDTIYDKAGYNDIVNINNINKNDLVIRFDIKIDETGNIIEDESKNMYITSTSDFGSTTKGIKVTDQFVVGHSIETITTADNYKLTTTQINTLRENVASWLHTNGFESVQQILDSNNTTNINNLIAEFQKADWQQV